MVRVVLVLLTLLVFNWQASPNLFFGVENATEASFLWSDEGRQIQMLENIQNTGSLKLLQQAYTSLYIHLSYLTAWGIESGSPISPKSFAYGSKWVSLVSMNLFLLVGFWMAYKVFASFSWALISMILLAGQSLNLLFATRIHPEATMILFVALTLCCATFFFLQSRTLYLWLMVICSALAVGSKPMAVFLGPWMLLIFLATLWQHRITCYQQILGWIIQCVVLFLVAFTISSPYQVFQLPEWIAGLLSENAYSAGKWAGRSGWEWFYVITGDSFLGPFFTLLFVVGAGFGIWQLFWGLPFFLKGGRGDLYSQKSFFLELPLFLKGGRGDFQKAFFLINLSWILIGCGYIMLSSRSFIDRYLIHAHFSFVMVMALGGYWLFHALKPNYKKWVMGVIVILVLAGIQGQLRLLHRDIKRRERMDQGFVAHRNFFHELQTYLPQDARVLYTRRVYMLSDAFPFAKRVREFINVPLLEKENIEYLIVNQNGRPGMKQKGIVPVTDHEHKVQETIRFWQKLEKNGVEGLFQVIQQYPDIQVTVYQKSGVH
ncbi:MAG: hypothetical protein HQM14_20120 [SAR324 cluster bacterium]|nr:hypothetical protein [SAR324 cluster bacterium]